MIDGEQTVLEVIERHPAATGIFAAFGFPDGEALRKTGAFLRIKTLRKTLGRRGEELAAALERAIESERDGETLVGRDYRQAGLTMVALFPCGLKAPLSRGIERFAAAAAPGARILMEGNVNHELNYYEYMEGIDESAELPELIVSADINSFFHLRFRERFLDAGVFEKLPAPTSPLFARSGLTDPEGQFRLIASNALVIVVDKTRIGNRPVPRSWEDLLDGRYERDITVRGDADFFCSAVLIPFHKLFGDEGVQALARNVLSGKHPAEMVKTAGTGNPEAAAILVMPYFFAKTIKRPENVEIVVPREGPLASPFSLFLKKNASVEGQALAEYLLGTEAAAVCSGAFFPAASEAGGESIPGADRLCWIGWDYIRDGDLGEKKKRVQDLFGSVFRRSSGCAC